MTRGTLSLLLDWQGVTAAQTVTAWDKGELTTPVWRSLSGLSLVLHDHNISGNSVLMCSWPSYNPLRRQVRQPGPLMLLWPISASLWALWHRFLQFYINMKLHKPQRTWYLRFLRAWVESWSLSGEKLLLLMLEPERPGEWVSLLTGERPRLTTPEAWSSLWKYAKRRWGSLTLDLRCLKMHSICTQNTVIKRCSSREPHCAPSMWMCL